MQQIYKFPGPLGALLREAQILEHQGRGREAVAAYDRAIAEYPGHAFAFTRRALLLFRGTFGPPPPPAEPKKGISRVSMSTLGMNGRFGNQLLQYGFLRAYAAEHGLCAEAPDWIGRDLYDLDDPLPAAPLTLVREDQFDFVASLNRRIPQVFRDADLWGYCCYPTGGLSRHRELFRALFRPGRRMATMLADAHAAVRARGDTLVAIHLRRGDFGYGRFWIAPAAWYADWLEAIWTRLRRPVLFVATDDPAAAASLARFAPVLASDLGPEIPGAEFFRDFHLLTQADVVAISNSSFSFAAALLNSRATAFMRPDRERGALVPFDPWDAPVLL